MYRVHIPATSGNMCVGFDSTGLAISIYNTIDFESRKSGLSIELDPPSSAIPTDARNLIVRAAKKAAERMGEKLPGLALLQHNRIPHTRGLGSSAACIVGGITIANTLLGSPWGKEQVLNLAAEMEGHPDNAAPAIYGGICISVKTEKGYAATPLPVGNDLSLCVIVPDFVLPTKKARQVLPKTIPLADAVSNISRMGLLVSALYEKDYARLSAALLDKLHEPYRKTLVTGFDDVACAAKELGAYGAFLSGAGPTILALIPGVDTGFAGALNQKIAGIPGNWNALSVDFDRRGAYVEEI